MISAQLKWGWSKQGRKAMIPDLPAETLASLDDNASRIGSQKLILPVQLAKETVIIA